MIGQSGLFIKELERRMSNKITKLENRRFEIIRNIQLCKENKERIARTIINLKSQYKQGAISYADYEIRLSSTLKQRTPEQWIEYYDDSISYYKQELAKCSREIYAEETKAKILPVAIIFSIIFMLGLGVYYLGPGITGFATYNETGNETINISVAENVSVAENISIIENVTNITEAQNISIENVTNMTAEITNISGIENLTNLTEEIMNITNISRWYTAEMVNPIKNIKEGYNNREAIVVNSSLLTEEGLYIYSEPIPIKLNKHKEYTITLYYKMVQMGDAKGEMVIDYYNEIGLFNSSIIGFSNDNGGLRQGYPADLLFNVDKDGWTKMEINLNKQENIKAVRIGTTFDMGLDYSPHYYLISGIEVR